MNGCIYSLTNNCTNTVSQMFDFSLKGKFISAQSLCKCINGICLIAGDHSINVFRSMPATSTEYNWKSFELLPEGIKQQSTFGMLALFCPVYKTLLIFVNKTTYMY